MWGSTNSISLPPKSNPASKKENILSQGDDAESSPFFVFITPDTPLQQYKEYDGMYLGHYVQYFFLVFFILGHVIFGLAIFLIFDSNYHWTKLR